MTRESDLLAAVVKEPDEDVHRLVYADWLEEHYQLDRARFIRAHVVLSRLTEDSSHRRELAFLTRQLLDANEKMWCKPLGGVTVECRWSRGFVEMMDVMASDLEEEGDDLFETYPLRRLVVSELFGKVDDLEHIPADNALTALDLIGNELGLRALKKLVKFRPLGGLSELGLMFNALRDTAVDFLCGEPFFQTLSRIRLGANPFTPRGRDRLRDHFGERVTFARQRDPERLYTIQDEYLRVGFGKDLTQFLMLSGSQRVRVAVFDHAGNLLRTQTRLVPQRASTRPQEHEARRAEVRDAWLNELGYESATIKVKRYHFDDGVGINDFNWWADVFDRPHDPERANLLQPLERWLTDGQFEFSFGNDNCWLDRYGEVTDT
jgi:uncharacterized protein (TIGR02996 family)